MAGILERLVEAGFGDRLVVLVGLLIVGGFVLAVVFRRELGRKIEDLLEVRCGRWRVRFWRRG